MAISNVQAQSQNDNGVGSTSALSFVSNNTAGNLLVLTILWTPRSNSISSVTDTLGNVWQVAIPKQTNNSSPELSNLALFYVANSRSGSNSVTVHYSGTGNFGVWTVAEYTNGTPGIWSFDQYAFTLFASSSTTPSSGSTGALGTADELLIGMAGTLRANENFTAGSGYVIPTGGSASANSQAEAQEWQESSSAVPQSAGMTFDLSSSWNAAIATFGPPGSGVISIAEMTAATASGTLNPLPLRPEIVDY